VKAPSGIARAEDVPTAHRHSHPCDSAADKASRAIRLLPTPAAPWTTIPEASEAKMAASMAPISSERPISGHAKRTWKDYVRSPQTLAFIAPCNRGADGYLIKPLLGTFGRPMLVNRDLGAGGGGGSDDRSDGVPHVWHRAARGCAIL
jgi:hypothetical protein